MSYKIARKAVFYLFVSFSSFHLSNVISLISLSFKQKIHAECIAALRVKTLRQQKIIQDAQQAAADDTKSSAGDKFETSREMMKQEIQKAQQQMAIYEKMEEVLMQISLKEVQDQVGLGSLIQTDEGLYYFSVSLGQLQVEGQKVFILSMASPFGKNLYGKTKGEGMDFRGRKILIEEIL